MRNENTGEETANPQNNQDDDSETESEDDENVERLSAWANNKFRGFRRVSPSNRAKKSKAGPVAPKNPPTTNQGQRDVPTPPTPGAAQLPPASSGTAATSQPIGAPNSINERLQTLAHERTSNVSQQFCHYFTNFGKCDYEGKTGYRCRFEHTVAPMCQSGTACSRPKCMYTHPNMGGHNMHFLDRRAGFQNNNGYQNNMGPWPQMMSQYMNPWNMQPMTPFQNMTPPFLPQNMERRQN